MLGRDTRHRDHFAARVGAGPLRMLVEWIEASMQRGELRRDLDPKLTALTMASISAFPFLVLPVIGEQFGLSLDELTPERLIEHNRALLGAAMRAPREET